MHTDIFSATSSLSESDSERKTFPSMRLDSGASDDSIPLSKAIALAVLRLSPVTMRTYGTHMEEDQWSPCKQNEKKANCKFAIAIKCYICRLKELPHINNYTFTPAFWHNCTESLTLGRQGSCINPQCN